MKQSEIYETDDGLFKIHFNRTPDSDGLYITIATKNPSSSRLHVGLHEDTEALGHLVKALIEVIELRDKELKKLNN